MNNYLSRYAKNDTHFQRTDPFKLASWDDEVETYFEMATCAALFLVAVALFAFIMFLVAV